MNNNVKSAAQLSVRSLKLTGCQMSSFPDHSPRPVAHKGSQRPPYESKVRYVRCCAASQMPLKPLRQQLPAIMEEPHEDGQHICRFHERDKG
mmetsp:Transcript_10921/g.29266  ORF Transcript_10921/g.29266 Transcript_10921/m.29266 type:complete len:92 (+) Transcript_10921:261-536(+)